jgi:hypothetical protein
MSKKKKSLADMKKEAMKKLQSKAPEIIQQTDEKAAGDGSSHGESIPLPIKDMGIYRENLLPASRERFIVSAFFTPNEMRYYKFAQRLVTSCIRHGLPYAVYQIPDVHSTISLNGCDDPAFTKANFIAYNMARFPDRNILYVDVDVVFVEYPVKIAEISDKGYDFAIYNWLGDEQNAGYSPLYKEAEGRRIVTEQYILTHYVPYYCPDQLRCSGGVQFYRNCPEVKSFLKAWLNVIAQSPYAADDECLDYTYNNPGSPSVKLNPVCVCRTGRMSDRLFSIPVCRKNRSACV